MSLERFERVLALVQRHDEWLAAWLAEGLSQYRSGESLDDALDMGRAAALERRNAALRYAASLIDGTPWQQAQQLARWAEYVEAIKFGEVEPTGSEIERAILRAGGYGLPLPTSAKQIARILRDTDA